MIVWRISNHITLDGVGGLKASARWHTRGRPIVYCAPNPATALLEVLVHAEVEPADLPVGYRYLKIRLPDDVEVEPVAPNDLPAGWRQDVAATRAAGDGWLRAERSPVLVVPSVIVSETANLLLNPAHPAAAGFAVEAVIKHDLDARLA